MSSVSRLLVSAFAITLVGSLAFAQELVDNPAYQAWARFKPGTSVTLTSETSMAGMSTKVDMTHKLAELTPEKAVVETTVAMPQGNNTNKMEILAKVKKEDVRDPAQLPPGVKGQMKVLPDEEVKVLDKTYKCKVVEFTGQQQEMEISGKSWTCPDIPGQLAKLETRMGGQMSGTTQLTVTALTIK